ncbi:hypothetical protein [Brenneria roseae]|nr:hypothetical protein [Brenneria roseae]
MTRTFASFPPSGLLALAGWYLSPERFTRTRQETTSPAALHEEY